jgi:hypothetical protein
MEQASQQVQENQTNRAQEEQQRAIDSMEQMLQTLQNSSKNRDEVLRRTRWGCSTRRRRGRASSSRWRR